MLGDNKNISQYHQVKMISGVCLRIYEPTLKFLKVFETAQRTNKLAMEII